MTVENIVLMSLQIIFFLCIHSYMYILKCTGLNIVKNLMTSNIIIIICGLLNLNIKQTIILLQMLISCLAFVTFAVENSLVQNRLQLTFTLVLTSVAFKFVVNQSLPRISYLTYLVNVQTLYNICANRWRLNVSLSRFFPKVTPNVTVPGEISNTNN